MNTLHREVSGRRSKNRYGYTEERLREALRYVDIRTYRMVGGCHAGVLAGSRERGGGSQAHRPEPV